MNRRSFLKASLVVASSGPVNLIGIASNARDRERRAVQVDSDGMLKIHGKREFIHGLYMLPNTAEPLREIAAAGFNLIHANADPVELAKANEHGLHAWISLGSISSAKNAEAQESMRKTIEAFRDNPALLFWETEDEPSFTWKKREARVSPEQIVETARFIKSIDPEHPLYLNHSPTNLVSTLQRYNGGAEIIATDIYPVIPPGIREMYALWPDGRQGDMLNSYVSQTGQYADKMRQVAGGHRAVFIVLQAFAWENLREKDRDPKLVLYPNRQQLRFMAWQSIVHGVNGILWWGLSYTPAEAPLWNDLKSVAREIKEVGHFLASRKERLPLDLEYHETGHSLDRGIEWTTLKSGRERILVAVNADPNPVEVTWRGLEKLGKCESLFEQRTIKYDGKSPRDLFEPFEAHLYKLSS